jgi:type I restriction enzyme M protein
MATDLNELQRKLWEAADQLRANSGLRSSEYSTPVLGLIFLLHADHRFAAVHAELGGNGTGRRKIGPADYHARGVLLLPEEARFDHLLRLPEGADLGKALNDAMKGVEAHNPDLAGVRPRAYSGLPNDVLVELVRVLHRIPDSIEGDGIGLIYEYLLSQFAARGPSGRRPRTATCSTSVGTTRRVLFPHRRSRCSSLNASCRRRPRKRRWAATWMRRRTIGTEPLPNSLG